MRSSNNKNMLAGVMGIMIVLALVAATYSATAQTTTCPDLITFYRPDSDVREHAKIDLDIRLISQRVNVGDFQGALETYSNGNFSKRSTSLRKLRNFSLDVEGIMNSTPYGGPFFDMYKKYWGAATYADAIVQAAALGQGDYANVPLVVRREIMVKTIQYQVLWMYVISELEDAITDCKVGDLENNYDSVHSWDEAVAFYSGSLEGASGTDAGYNLWTLAEKRCGAFNMCEFGGRSKTNHDVIGLFSQGQAHLRAGDCDSAAQIIREIRSLMTVPLIQGALRYAHRGKSAQGWVGSTTDFVKERAEGWAFTMAILPQIANCSASDAELIKNNLKFDVNPYNPAGSAAILAAFQNNYKCMGIRCSDIGSMVEDDKTVIFPACVDANTEGGLCSTGAAGRVSAGIATVAMLLVSSILAALM